MVVFEIANSLEQLEEFRDVYGMRFVGLEDPNNTMYQTYRVPSAEAPYPQDIIIDQFGRVSYWSWEYDPQEIIDVIDYLLTCFCIVDPDATEPKLQLYQPRPSVFSRDTDIWFQLIDPGPARIDVFDAAGRHVRTLLDGRQRAGDQRVRWSGRDQRQRPVADGVYFIRMDTGGAQHTRRVLKLR